MDKSLPVNNPDDFNNKYAEYLEDGFDGLSIDHKEVLDFLDVLFGVLTHDQDFRYQQIKLKFKQCRFYSNLPLAVEFMIEREIDRILNHELVTGVNTWASDVSKK